MMKSVVIFILLFFSFMYCGQAQNTAIDSLNTLIRKAKSDTTRINLTNDMVYKISEINLDSAIALGKKIIHESRKLGYKKGEIDALRNLSSNLMMKGDFKAAEANLKDAKAIVSMIKDSATIATIYATYGMMYGMQSKYDSANMYYQKAIDIAERQGNKKMLARNYGNLGIGYQMQSKFSEALIYQLKSLKFAEELNDINSQAYTSVNMGSTYLKMGDTLRSEKILLKAIELAKQVGIKNVEIYGYTNLASLYASTEKWDETYIFAMKAAKLAQEMGDIPIEVASYSKAATALAHQKKYVEAEALVKKGMPIAESSGQPIIISQLNSGMGTVLKLQEKYVEAIPYFERSLQAFKNADQYDENIGEVYSDLAICYEKTGTFEKALKNYKEFSTIKDSIRNKENIQKATELSMNYEFEKKEQAQQLEQKIKDAAARLRQLTLMIGLGLTLILVFVVYRALRIKQKGNAKLQVQKEEIERTLSQLENTQSQLIQSEKMASLGELTAGIAHEIQNPLNFVNNFSEVNRELIEELKEERSKKKNVRDEKLEAELLTDIDQNLEKIFHHGKRADSIVKGMLQHSRSSSGVREPTDINALCDEYLRLAYHGLRAKDKAFNATLETDFDSSIGTINIVPQDMGRVILNLITNAFYACTERLALSEAEVGRSAIKEKKLKYLDKDFAPTVSVSTKKVGDNVEIRVSDNGNGIPDAIKEKIFQPFFTTKPTGQGTGLGLSMSYDIVTKGHGGKLEVESEEGEGTTFTIILPVSGKK